MKELLLYFSTWIEPFFLIYFAFINVVYILLFILGTIKIFIRRQEIKTEAAFPPCNTELLPNISFIVPVYNESRSILACIKNLSSLSYQNKRVVIVNDGSQDKTLEILDQELNLLPIPQMFENRLPCAPIHKIYQSTKHPEFLVVDKEHKGKYDALNTGLNLIDTEFFFIIDADTFIDDAGFESLIRRLITQKEIIAIGASVRVKNGCSLNYNRLSTTNFPKDYLTALQSLEYQRAFFMRQGWDYLKGNCVISGAFSGFSTECVVKAGGFCDSYGEDMEIIVRLHRLMRANNLPYKMYYLPDPIAWTEVPYTWKNLARQRIKWHLTLLEVMWIHKRMLFNPKYGLFGMFSMPFWVFGEGFEPLFELAGIIYLIIAAAFGILNVPFFLFMIFSCFIGFYIYSLFCLLIEEVSFRKYPSFKTLVSLLGFSLVENIGFRQLTLIWRLQSFIEFFTKRASCLAHKSASFYALRKVKGIKLPEKRAF